MRLRGCILLAVFAANVATWAGDLTGTVTLLNARGRPTDLGKGQVIVFVDGLQERFSQESIAKAYQMDTLNKQYDPQLMVIPKGATVTFTNFDPILHNIFSVSGKNRFDAGLFRENETTRHTFLFPGLVRIYCNVHHDMNALIYVTDNPYFAFADADGRFRIPGVPAGTITLKALHRVAGETVATVVVDEQGETLVNLELHAQSKRLKRHLDKEGKPYRKRKDNRY